MVSVFSLPKCRLSTCQSVDFYGTATRPRRPVRHVPGDEDGEPAACRGRLPARRGALSRARPVALRLHPAARPGRRRRGRSRHAPRPRPGPHQRAVNRQGDARVGPPLQPGGARPQHHRQVPARPRRRRRGRRGRHRRGARIREGEARRRRARPRWTGSGPCTKTTSPTAAGPPSRIATTS